MSLERIKKDLVESSKFGRDPPRKIETYDDLDPEDGITRPLGSEANKKARDYVVKQMKEAGMEVNIDKIGNIFGIKKGSDPTKKSVMVGSHIDSVVNGGIFDGALGVMSGIEVVRRINDDDFEHERNIEVVVYTEEEGSGFNQSLLGSSVLAGEIDLEDALRMKNEEGKTVEEALKDNGYKGDYEKNLDDIEYALEMHIEQGPVLQNKDIPVGIVENITGLGWIFGDIKGEEDHAGTTPMSMRKDALVAASDIVKFVNKRANEIVEERDSSTVGTVGKLTVRPNGTNIVPGKVEMGIDIRDVVKDNMDELMDETLSKLEELEKKYGVEVETEIPMTHEPSPLSEEVVNTIEKSAQEIKVEALRMDSGAGHDSQNIAHKVKTGMIFVPSVDGISHSPMEWTDWDDIEKGTKVLTQTVKNLSK